jgi:hypothetical protein
MTQNLFRMKFFEGIPHGSEVLFTTKPFESYEKGRTQLFRFYLFCIYSLAEAQKQRRRLFSRALDVSRNLSQQVYRHDDILVRAEGVLHLDELRDWLNQPIGVHELEEFTGVSESLTENTHTMVTGIRRSRRETAADIQQPRQALAKNNGCHSNAGTSGEARSRKAGTLLKQPMLHAPHQARVTPGVEQLQQPMVQDLSLVFHHPPEHLDDRAFPFRKVLSLVPQTLKLDVKVADAAQYVAEPEKLQPKTLRASRGQDISKKAHRHPQSAGGHPHTVQGLAIRAQAGASFILFEMPPLRSKHGKRHIQYARTDQMSLFIHHKQTILRFLLCPSTFQKISRVDTGIFS